MEEFDLIVVGSGTAAKNAAYTCNAVGWDVAVIDSRPFGGTCVLRGCDPKKVLVGVAATVDRFNRYQGSGTAGGPAEIDWPTALEFKRSFVEGIPEATEEGLREAGIASYHERARFEDERTICVNDADLRAEKILIATGSKPLTLGIEGEEHLTTSDEFLELDELPGKIVFVGGGFISFEFAHIAARAGSEVQILEALPRPLGPFDPDLVELLVNSTEEHGIEVHTETRAQAIRSRDSDYEILISKDGEERTLRADLVVHGAGRVPQIDDLDLERANVAREKGGVSVNEYLQSVSNPAVYAAGDCAATEGPMLTPVAGREGDIAAANMLEGNHKKPDYAGTGSVVFTISPLASVGLSEEAASENGLDFDVNYGETSGWYTSQQSRTRHAGYKTLIEKESGRILGAHVLGHHAEEIINLFGLAIRERIPADNLKEISWGYPTATSDIQYMV